MGSAVLTTLIIAFAVIVGGILLWGISNFGRGKDPKQSNRIMQYRIAAQFVAVLVVVGLVWLRSRGAN